MTTCSLEIRDQEKRKEAEMKNNSSIQWHNRAQTGMCLKVFNVQNSKAQDSPEMRRCRRQENPTTVAQAGQVVWPVYVKNADKKESERKVDS